MYDKADLEIRDNRIIVKVWNNDKTNYHYETLIEVQHGNFNQRNLTLKLALTAISK